MYETFIYSIPNTHSVYFNQPWPCFLEVTLNLQYQSSSTFTLQSQPKAPNLAISPAVTRIKLYLQPAIMSERKFFVGGNWKMNGDKASINGIVEFLKTGPLNDSTGEFCS